MVPLFQPERGISPFISTGLVQIQGDNAKQQKPDILVYYDGSTTAVPTLVCPGHLRLPAAFGDATGNPVEIPFFDIRKIVTVVGTNTSAKKKVQIKCDIANCADNDTYGVKIERMPTADFPVVRESRYFQFEAGLADDCKTDCTTRAATTAAMINADPNAPVVASVDSTTVAGEYWLVLEDKTFNADFRVQAEGFDMSSYTVLVNYASPSYTAGAIRQAYPSFAPSLADNVVLTATEITFERRIAVNGFGGTSSTASFEGMFELERRLAVVLTNAANTNSAAAKTELDAITNGTKSTALYLDKNC